MDHINPYTGSGPKDSLPIDAKLDNDYLEMHYPKLKPIITGTDTIHKSSDKSIDLSKRTTLSTLKSKADNNFITRNLFSLIIKENQPYKGQLGVNSSLYFAHFANKRIRKIRIQQLDVFGPTLLDTLRQASGWIEKTGNAIHLKTTEQKLRMQLLFNSGETVNPQLMAENEKVIRDLPYIQDVAFNLSNSENETDMVDVLIIIKERFEYAISGNLSSNSSELAVIDQNMFGIGHQFSANMDYYQPEKPNFGGSLNYEISDLGGKFIRSGLGYTNTYRKKGWNAFLDKKFIASTIDWAGGISLERVFSDRYLTPYSYTRLDTAAAYLNSDIWFGRQLKNQNFYSPIGNIIIAGRYFHQNFYNEASDHFANSLFRNHDFILGSIGISKRYLFKNNQIYGYGITEDIPYGRFAELAMGCDIEANRSRPYLQFRYSKANILKGGSYFKWQIGIGGYFCDSQVEQGAILLSTNYFTNYIYLNRHPYRFFVNMELLSGINRFKEEYLVINRKFGIRDYFSLDTKGTNRLKINIESVRFWGWNNSGFRFANYFFADAAFLSNELRKIFNDNFYAGIGLGIRVHNESLVFNVLEVRLSWIPIAPKNNNPFIFNAFGQPKARFDDFLGGKPQEILYQ
ncbi:MAG: hypothetical protein NTY07_02840 [Bacteroidia bacterium]|nr:hypothetical protein [Bacteroidia bacterium]